MDKKLEHTLMLKVLRCYVELSPENLWMDGEATPAQARARANHINGELGLLFKQLGRKVSEEEAYNYKSNNESE